MTKGTVTIEIKRATIGWDWTALGHYPAHFWASGWSFTKKGAVNAARQSFTKYMTRNPDDTVKWTEHFEFD